MHTSSRRLLRLALALGTVLLITGAAQAQPFGAWMNPTGLDYLKIPHNSALNPTGAITLEAWVATSGTSCQSLFGKNWTETYWLGICDGTVRSYLRGMASQRDGGQVKAGEWTHVAVTFDGTARRHYVNGEQVGQWNEPGPLTTNSAPLRIGSDIAWAVSVGSLDEVRLWSVARTKGQLREWINQRITSSQPGILGVWALDGGAAATVGPHNGSFVGSPGFLTFPVTLDCNPSTNTTICLSDRFAVRLRWRTQGGTEGVGTRVACGTPNTGLFWFFNPNNWEVLIKTLNGCGFPDPKHWIFFSSTTNVFYRLEVTDVQAGAAKIYFNYPGAPAPAVTDTSAFDTCP